MYFQQDEKSKTRDSNRFRTTQRPCKMINIFNLGQFLLFTSVYWRERSEKGLLKRSLQFFKEGAGAERGSPAPAPSGCLSSANTDLTRYPLTALQAPFYINALSVMY